MTVELVDEDAPDCRDFVVSWMSEAMRSALRRTTDDVFPFALVQLITATEDAESGTVDNVIQIDYLDVARDGMEAAEAANATATRGHRRMKVLARNPLEDVVLSDGSTANLDYLRPTLGPIEQPYINDRVVRLVARYEMGFSNVAVT